MKIKAIEYLTILLIIIPTFLFGDIIIVDQNGTGNYSSIQEGINNANTGDTVLVYPGNYIEIVDFTGKDIVLASLFLTTQDTSYISQTIIDGNHENYRLVRFVNGETDNASLIGFTITNASGPLDKSYKWESQGLGIYINGSSPLIENNHIINNSYSDWYLIGGGIVIENSSAKIINNNIRNNDMAYKGGGIYINNSTNVQIENNCIEYNMVCSGYGVTSGAGIYIDSSQHILISNNFITDNYSNNCGFGGGIYILRSDHITILNNKISDNGFECIEGGGIYTILSTDIFIIGNLLYNNKADWHGGGAYFENSEILLVNNTIVSNEAISPSGAGGGIACLNSNPVIYNTILYSNFAVTSGDQVFLDANSDPDFFYSDIEGGVAAFGLADTVVYNGHYENNIDTDPQFLLSGDDPYELGINSPCINAGNPDTSGLSIPELDLAGNLRIVQDIIDIGAYEYQYPVNIFCRDKQFEVYVFPNPASNLLNVSFKKGAYFKLQLINIKDGILKEVNKAKNIQKLTLNINNLKSGSYILRAVSEQGFQNIKFIKH